MRTVSKFRRVLEIQQAFNHCTSSEHLGHFIDLHKERFHGFRLSFLRHQGIYRPVGSFLFFYVWEDEFSIPVSPFDESLPVYPSTGCSPAEPASVSTDNINIRTEPRKSSRNHHPQVQFTSYLHRFQLNQLSFSQYHPLPSKISVSRSYIIQ